MLQISVRVVFVLSSVLIGLTTGPYFYNVLIDTDMPTWFGGAMGFGIAVTIIAMEQAFRKHFNRSLVAFLMGLAAGLVLSYLLISVLDVVIQNEELKQHLDVPLALFTTYLVLITVLRNADRFRVVIPFVEFRPQSVTEGSLVLDISALCDGRLVGLLEAGLLDQRLLVHRRVVATCESMSSSEDTPERLRGQRGLTSLTTLRDRLTDRLLIDDTELPQAESLTETLIGLAQLEDARVATSERETADRLRAEGVRVLDIGLLGHRLAPLLVPGERLTVPIERAGDGQGQGVGHLDDGSMVVVSGAKQRIGEQVEAIVVRIHHTANGRMVFADLDLTDPESSSRRRGKTGN